MKPLRASILALALPVALLLLQGTARADLGFEGANRPSAAPGELVQVTVGCGFCFPQCVGRPGHRHPPGDLDGGCMPGGHGDPPSAFPIWLTPASHRLDRGSRPSRPPHLASFTYLGRAAPAPNRLDPLEVPRYVLSFRVPALAPGPYRYVLYCPGCAEGPLGTLIESGPAPPVRLRIGASSSASSTPAWPWILGGIGAAIALSAAIVLVRRHRVIAISHP
jgi:hypothetical protein